MLMLACVMHIKRKGFTFGLLRKLKTSRERQALSEKGFRRINFKERSILYVFCVVFDRVFCFVFSLALHFFVNLCGSSERDMSFKPSLCARI